MLKWNDTDAFHARVEGKLGSFNVSLPNEAIELYKADGGDNWNAYASMISDIRTVCPLQELANLASRSVVPKNYAHAHFDGIFLMRFLYHEQCEVFYLQDPGLD